MCFDPLSIALIAGGAAISAASSISAGNSKANAEMVIAKNNATSKEMQAQQNRLGGDAERIAAQYEARLMDEKRKQMAGKQNATFAGQGVLIDEGTPVDAAIDSAIEFDQDKAAIEYKGLARANQLYKQAALNEKDAQLELQGGMIKAKAAKKEGQLGAWKAVGSALTSAPVMTGASSALKSFTGSFKK